jgi:hypothetical protein
MKKTLKLNESEFKSHVKEIVRHQINLMETENMPFTYNPQRYVKTSFEQMADNNSLDEGLIRTYPSEWVEKYLSSRINSDFVEAHFDDEHLHFWFVLKQGSKSIEPLKQKMNSFGYYCAAEYDIPEGRFLQFEPKFTEYRTGSNLKMKFNDLLFYHVSPVYMKEKILKNGLVPKSKNDYLVYPDRVYLIRATSEGKEDIYDLAGMLYDKKKDKRSKGIYSLFGVKPEGLDDIKFYVDKNMFGSNGYFTYENIPPENMVFIEDFDASQYIPWGFI